MAEEPDAEQVKHDLWEHVAAGGFGVWTPTCPRCREDLVHMSFAPGVAVVMNSDAVYAAIDNGCLCGWHQPALGGVMELEFWNRRCPLHGLPTEPGSDPSPAPETGSSGR